MKRLTLSLATVALCAACATALALSAISDTGTWPQSWPKALEPLRKQARSITGETAEQLYQIPFTDRAQFEAAWPHLLSVKSKGAPVILVRSPHTFLGSEIKGGGVIVYCPPGATNQANPGKPIPGQSNPRVTWMATTFIELIVDGQTVDLNRIPLPPDAPIIDERFPPAPAAPAKPAAPDRASDQAEAGPAAPAKAAK